MLLCIWFRAKPPRKLCVEPGGNQAQHSCRNPQPCGQVTSSGSLDSTVPSGSPWLAQRVVRAVSGPRCWKFRLRVNRSSEGTSCFCQSPGSWEGPKGSHPHRDAAPSEGNKPAKLLPAPSYLSGQNWLARPSFSSWQKGKLRHGAEGAQLWPLLCGLAKLHRSKALLWSLATQ